MKFNFRSILLLVLIVVVVIAAFSYFSGALNKKDDLTYSEIIQMFEDDIIVSFVVKETSVLQLKTLTPKLNEDGSYERTAEGRIVFQQDSSGAPVYTEYSYELSTTTQLNQLNEIAYEKYTTDASSNLEEYDYTPAEGTPWWQAILPYVIVGICFIGLWIFMLKQAPGGGNMNNFSKSKAKVTNNDKDPVKFADVAGADEEKAELEEVVEFLKAPEKFVKLGARIPRGVLLVGPPGTGKTLLAKAVAGEAGVPFFSISGSDFVEMYVGVGASRVRDLFENARKTNASIIFIDEIDAVGRHRGAGLGGGHDEREQTLNQLLVEMDGFGTNSGVIVMAATNRPDILDPALLRPGRFDRRVTVNYPDMNGREAILRVHCRNKPLEESVDLRKIAQTTIGFTGAELANLMNEAALRAAKKNKALIGMEDIEESYMKLLLGPQKKSKLRTEADNKLCAYHEAGHAVASYFCKHTDPIKHITIIPAGSTGGVTLSVPTEDRMTSSRNEMIDHIVLALGGRVAEEIVLDDISTGASNDIQQATNIARNMVTRYGMSSKLGTVLYGSANSSDEVFLGRQFSTSKDYSEKTAAEIDDEIRAIISDCYTTCKNHLSANIDKLHFVAEFLLKNESMDEEQFRVAMETENPTIEQIENIAEDKKKKSAEENNIAHETNRKAEEEARERARLEAERIAKESRERQERANSGAFSSDDFFSTVWNAPNTSGDDESTTDSTDENPSDSDNSNK
ncbi:MAG: ATP-dependent zinc metalloprotease FtsH [Clostridia bacterium]|nr:ATP-dependent zinc metalloprotease FtsH [Clostridia bacterium]